MQVAVITLEGFNEIDSMVAAHIINRVPGWSARITAPTSTVISMNGIAVTAQEFMAFARKADAVIIGSGRKTREHINNAALMDELALDPSRQLIASQCSGALVLMRLGLLTQGTICTDGGTRADVLAAGFEVPEAPFYASGRVATAGGCLASHYLAAWMIWSGAGRQATDEAMSYVVPRGQEDDYIQRMAAAVGPYVIDVSGASQAGAPTVQHGETQIQAGA